MDGTQMDNSNNELKLSNEDIQRAEALAARMDGDIQLAVRMNPNGPVSQAVLASNGTTEGVVGKLIEQRLTVGLPPELQRMVNEQLSAIEAQRKAENKAALGVVAGVAEMASNVAANNAYAESMSGGGRNAATSSTVNYSGADYARMSAEDMANISATQYEKLSAEDKQNFHREALDKARALKDASLEVVNDRLDKMKAAGMSDEQIKTSMAAISGLGPNHMGPQNPDDELVKDGKVSPLGRERALKRIEATDMSPEHKEQARKMLDATIDYEQSAYAVVQAREALRSNERGNDAEAFTSGKNALGATTEVIKRKNRPHDNMTMGQAMDSALKDGDLSDAEMRRITGYSAYRDYRYVDGPVVQQQAEQSLIADAAATAAAKAATTAEQKAELNGMWKDNVGAGAASDHSVAAAELKTTRRNDFGDDDAPKVASVAAKPNTTIDIGDAKASKLASPLAQFIAPVEVAVAENPQISEPSVAVTANKKPAAPQAGAGMA